MKSPRFEEPRLAVAPGGELSLSGEALVELMRAVLARDVPFRFRALGWSMAPFIRDGDVITVAPLRDALPGVGEVVAFLRPSAGNLIIHRIVARRGTGSYIRGDSAPANADGIVPAENLLGRVTRVERDGRDVWLGLGPERTLIAWLSRAGWLIPLHTRATRWLSPLRGR